MILEYYYIMFLLYIHYLMSCILTQGYDIKFPNSISFFLFILYSLHNYIH